MSVGSFGHQEVFPRLASAESISQAVPCQCCTKDCQVPKSSPGKLAVIYTTTAKDVLTFLCRKCTVSYLVVLYHTKYC